MTVLVIGNAAIDRTYCVDWLPRAGETVLAVVAPLEVGGKGLNQAVVARRAGSRTRLVAAIGADQGGELVRKRLLTEDIAIDGLHVVDEVRTDESILTIAASGENTIVTTVAAAERLPETVIKEEIGAMAPGEILLLQGNLGRPQTAAALSCGRARGLRSILNAAPVAFDYSHLLGLVDLLVVNEIEAAALHMDLAATSVITEGARGATLIRGGRRAHLPALPAAAADTSGAGDTVCGVLAAGFASGVELTVALRWALDAAALTVSRRGAYASLPTAAELTRIAPRLPT